MSDGWSAICDTGIVETGLIVVGTGVGAVVWVGAGPCGFGKIADRQPALNSTTTRIATRTPEPYVCRTIDDTR